MPRKARVLACLQVVVRSASCQRTKSFSTLKEVTGSALYLAGGVAVPAAPSLRAIALRRMRPRSPNRIGHEVLTSHMETCWSRGFRVNETLRRKFTCVAAYFFVRQDSRTSVALCTACPPNRMSISLRFSSFQLIVHAELRLAYLYQYYSINNPSPTSSKIASFVKGGRKSNGNAADRE